MRDGQIYAAVSDKLQLKELAEKDAEIVRLRGQLHHAELSRDAAGKIIDRLRNEIEVSEACNRTKTMAIAEACDLLAERAYGSPARSPAHNARLRLEAAIKIVHG